MSYTAQTLANDAFEKIKTLNPQAPASLIPRIYTLIPAALELLADRVKRSIDYRGLQTDFSVTPVAGLVDLTALAGILFDINRSTVRVSATNDYLSPVDNIITLENGGLPNDQPYYAQDGTTLRIRSVTPLLTDYTTPLKIKSNYIPSLTDAALPLPSQYEGALLETVVEMAVKPNAEEMAATGRA